MPCIKCEGPTKITESIYQPKSVRVGPWHPNRARELQLKDGYHLHVCLRCEQQFTTVEVPMDSSGYVIEKIRKQDALEGKG